MVNYSTRMMQQVEAEQNGPQEEEPFYAVDVKSFEASGRSYAYALYSRLCWRDGCPLSTGDGKPAPFSQASLTDYSKALASHCSREPDYLLPGTPITEAVFRLLISNGNRPVTLPEVQAGLTAAWASVIYLKNLSDDVLRRMLDQPNEYHMTRVPAPTRR